MIISYATLADRLTLALNLTQPPISICLTNTAPSGMQPFEGKVPAGCRFWQEAATRTFATSAADHSLCAVGIHTHHLQSSPEQLMDLQDALRVFADLGYVRSEDVPQIPVLTSSPQHVLYGPLVHATTAPDIVMLFVHASQSMILTEATQQIESLLPPAMGRPACAVVPQVMNSGRAALSMGCCGARAYLDVLGNDTAIFAIPGSKLMLYVERIEALSNANAVLTSFHRVRRQDVEKGHSPSIKRSLEMLQAQ